MQWILRYETVKMHLHPIGTLDFNHFLIHIHSPLVGKNRLEYIQIANVLTKLKPHTHTNLRSEMTLQEMIAEIFFTI